MQQARELLERLETTPDEHGSGRHVRLLAARQLLRDGQLDEARNVLETLLAERAWPKAQAELEKVIRQRDLAAAT